MSTPIIREPRWACFYGNAGRLGRIFRSARAAFRWPSWGLLGVTILLVISLFISHRRGRYDITRILSFTANIIITVAMIASLIFSGPRHPEAFRNAAGAAALRVYSVGYKRDCFRTVVLEARCGRPHGSR